MNCNISIHIDALTALYTLYSMKTNLTFSNKQVCPNFWDGIKEETEMNSFGCLQF